MNNLAFRHFLFAITPVLLLTACSSAVDEQGYAHDPLEPVNRKVFAFNETVDKAVLKPIAKGYETVVPQPIRKSIHNFFSNIDDVRSLGNAVLQLDGQATAGITARVINNTVYGLGGIFDVATPMGNPKINRDFGGTLAHYGVPSGPYLVLPLFGPSTVRDAVSKIPDHYMTLVTYVENDKLYWTMIGSDTIQKRAALLPMEKQISGAATDRYTMIRDTWLQHRWGQLGTPIKALENNEDVDALFAPETSE